MSQPSAFERLTPAFQYQIVETLGFRGLRPVQEQAIEAVLSGDHCVVLAPTAGGKTEAAFFPVISELDRIHASPVSVVYVSPIRALLNNQEERIERYAGLVGRTATKWHGDITASARKAFLARPTDILLTTPESLEAMLISERVSTNELFRELRFVIIDEVHAFAGDDRGAHLAALLERLVRIAGRDVQRIGLSATVGNPERILQWMQGSSRRAARLVDPGGARKSPEISIDFVGHVPNAAKVVAALHRGEKRLLFTDSRRTAEEAGKALVAEGVSAFVTHGSLSLTERKDAERMFVGGEDCVIVATSVLELGIDVGDLDRVLQIDAPTTVASFLQRMGRTGRREDTRPNCLFLCTKDAMVVQALALVSLAGRGWVEPVLPSERAAHVYAQQVMSIAVMRHGTSIAQIEADLAGTTSFARLDEAERAAIVAHMYENDLLADQDGKLWLGPEGERLYARAGFRELYAVFDAPRLIRVLHHQSEVGTVDALFLGALLDRRGDRPTLGGFVLAGKAWEITHVDWSRGVATVVPAADARAPRWSGSPRFLSYDVCQEIRRHLIAEDEPSFLTPRALNALRLERARHAFLRDAERPFVETTAEITWWTFAGGAANLVLARLFERALGEKVTATNHRISFRGRAGESLAAVQGVITTLRDTGRPTSDDALDLVSDVARQRLSKFEPCLPDRSLRALQAEKLFDVTGARRALG
jgi:ATP-dependent Lhr-like helicase